MFGNPMGHPMFGQMHVGQMNVNFNFGQNNPMNPMMPQQFPGMMIPGMPSPMLGYQGNQVEEESDESVREIDAEVVEAVDMDCYKFVFDKCKISNDLNITFDEGGLNILKDNKPKSKYDTFNPHYKIRSEEGYHTKYGDEVFADIEVRENLPAIVTMVNIDHIEDEDKCLIDQILLHACLWTKKNRQTSFYLIIEETGLTGLGEPMISFINGKGINRQEIFSISIKEMVKE